MRLVFSHVQYHVELCLSKVCFTTCNRISGGRGGGGKKKNSVSRARCRVRASRAGGWALSLSPSARGLGCLESENFWSRTFWRGSSPRHPFWQCRKTSSWANALGNTTGWQKMRPKFLKKKIILKKSFLSRGPKYFEKGTFYSPRLVLWSFY